MNTGDESKKVAALVADWRSGEYTMFEAATEEPEIAWQAILELSRLDLTDADCAMLTGPLETLLSWHGVNFIDRVLDEAKLSKRFNLLLGGVWGQRIPKEIRDRIAAVRGRAW
jgi:hypothetical protein